MIANRNVIALVVAAGTGSRAGTRIAKQFSLFDGKMILRHAVDSLLAHPNIGRLVVVHADGQDDLVKAALVNLDADILLVVGGASRQESVRKGLNALFSENAKGPILIHDAARPFIPVAVIDRLLAALKTHKGAIPVLPVVDTLVRGCDKTMSAAVDRADLWRVQTPQAFDFASVWEAHTHWPDAMQATDDSQILAAAGHCIALVDGDELLAKLTYPDDFKALKKEPPMPSVRIGQGYDVHQLAAGEDLWLAGVKIDHEFGLKGHSDADVALHAITDAILGACAVGDIGSHFPPSDPQWRGASSGRFLAHAVQLAQVAGFQIGNIDLTIICERPKIAPYRDAMRLSIAQICNIPIGAVSVKATTTEGLGFAGRREGIAAQAVALVIQ